MRNRDLSERPRVLYLIDSLAPGGAERSLVDMAPGLLDGGIDLEVAVLHDRPGLAAELRSHGVHVHVVSGSNRSSWLAGTVRLIRGRHPDLVHTTLFESDVIGRVGATLTRVPVVSTLANTPYGHEHAAESGVDPIRLRAAQAVDMVTGRVVRRFHAVSRSTAEACVAKLRIDPTKIDVVPRGRDISRFGIRTPDRRRAVRTRLGVDSDEKVLLVVARQEPQKGIEVLIRAVPELRKLQPQVRVLVAGREGRATAGLRALISATGTDGVVDFLGERDDIPDLLATADVFVLPSYREGLPGAVLEAMAMGVPIVASDLPNVRDAVPTDEYALLVPSGDHLELARAIASVLQDPVAGQRRAHAASQRFAVTFDIRCVSQAMTDFYRRALA